ncbi:haloacid dehalogenase [Amycolatopsis thailandensis]|uniref:phosphoserine phosphatase n=1 Tax=Amycolatopsis thailandensis TaxID=589330 RepID=A0A229SB72_9PSEU|nr:haloacid dehalogenase [Amycolatopsis thailandensis]
MKERSFGTQAGDAVEQVACLLRRRNRSNRARGCRVGHAGSVVSSALAAVFFDVDGTLVPETSSSAFLAGFLGHYDELVTAEDAYAAGTMDNHQVSVLDASGWAGTSETQIRDWLHRLPLVTGIAETVAWCWRNGLVPMLSTLAWAPVGGYLASRFGFHAFCGPRLETERGLFTGRVSHHFDEHGKRDFAVSQARELNLEPSSCAAIGDSRSDLPLFGAVGLSVAFNASTAARASADTVVDSDDLRAVIPSLSRLIRSTRR